MSRIWMSQYPERPVVEGFEDHFILKRTDGTLLALMPADAELSLYNMGGKVYFGCDAQTKWKTYWFRDGDWVYRSDGSGTMGNPADLLEGGTFIAGVNILEPTKQIIDKTNNNVVWMEAFEFWKEEELPPEEPDEPTLPDTSTPFFTFNGVDCPSFLKVISVGISALPSIEVNMTSIPRKYGALDSGTTFGGKVYTIEVMLVHRKKSLFQMASELATFLKGDNWKLSKLTFKDLSGKHLMAKVSNSVDISDLQVAGSGTIEFVVPTPLYIADEETEVTSSTKIFTVENNGTHEVQPVITMNLTSTSTGIEILNNETNKTFKVAGSFKTGDTLELDMNRKLIKLNDVANMNILDISSDWLELVQGNNTLIVNTSATTTVRFKEMYE